MKTTFRLLATAAISVLAFVSCDKENLSQNEGSASSKGRVITVSFKTDPSTKTALNGLTPQFVADDKIMVTNGTVNETCTVSVDKGVASITISKSELQTGDLTAVYPSSAFKATAPYYKVSSTQSGKFADANICTATITKETTKAEFENQTAIFCFQDSEGYTAKKLLVISTGESLIADEGADTKTITIGDGLKAVEGVYMAVKPGVKISELVVGAGEGRRYLGRKADGTANDGDPEVKINTKYDVALPVLNGHEYVELTMTVGDKTKTYKWATMNVGASSPTEYGGYFMWGDTTGHSAATTGANAFQFGTDSKGFAWENCPHTNGVYSDSNKNVFTKYTAIKNAYASTGTADNKTTLESSDDAATVNWGSGWRMPTKAEFDALKSLSSKDWTTDYNGTGVNGCVFSDGTNRVFVPAAGAGYGSELSDAGSGGIYWSSSLDTDDPCDAYYLFFISSDGSTSVSNRYYGFSVRPLSE